VDRCVTGAGARQLAEDLSAPLLDRAVIEERLELVQWLYDDALLREDLRGQLRSLPDAGRALGRVVAGRGSPRDLGQLRDGLAGAARLAGRLARVADRPTMLDALLPALVGHDRLIDLFMRALVPAPPTERSQGASSPRAMTRTLMNCAARQRTPATPFPSWKPNIANRPALRR
jgi:DNA mismatch repair protein MutS